MIHADRLRDGPWRRDMRLPVFSAGPRDRPRPRGGVSACMRRKMLSGGPHWRCVVENPFVKSNRGVRSRRLDDEAASTGYARESLEAHSAEFSQGVSLASSDSARWMSFQRMISLRGIGRPDRNRRTRRPQSARRFRQVRPRGRRTAIQLLRRYTVETPFLCRGAWTAS